MSSKFCTVTKGQHTIRCKQTGKKRHKHWKYIKRSVYSILRQSLKHSSLINAIISFNHDGIFQLGFLFFNCYFFFFILCLPAASSPSIRLSIHGSVHPFLHSLHFFVRCLFVHSFTRSHVRSFLRSFARLLVRSICSFTRSLVRLYAFIRSFYHPFVCSFACSLVRS